MLKLKLRNKNFWLYNFTGFSGSELLEIYYTLLFLMKDYSQLPEIDGFFYRCLIGTEGGPTFIRLELQEDQNNEILIDSGVDSNGTRTHKISQIDLSTKLKLIYFDFLFKRILINGEESKYIDIEETYTNYSNDTGLLNFINTTLNQYFPKYKLTSHNRVLPDSSNYFITWPLEHIELEYQISVRLLRDCYISRYVFGNKNNQYIIVIWNNTIPFDFSSILFLLDEIQKLGVYLIFEEKESEVKENPNIYW